MTQAFWLGAYGEYKVPPIVLQEASRLDTFKELHLCKGQGFELLKLWGDSVDDVMAAEVTP